MLLQLKPQKIDYSLTFRLNKQSTLIMLRGKMTLVNAGKKESVVCEALII